MAQCSVPRCSILCLISAPLNTLSGSRLAKIRVHGDPRRAVVLLERQHLVVHEVEGHDDNQLLPSVCCSKKNTWSWCWTCWGYLRSHLVRSSPSPPLLHKSVSSAAEFFMAFVNFLSRVPMCGNMTGTPTHSLGLKACQASSPYLCVDQP